MTTPATLFDPAAAAASRSPAARRASTFIALATCTLLGSLVAPASAPAQALDTRTITVDVGAQDPAVSPDGSRIAVSILGKIFFLPIDGGRAEPVTDGLGWDTRPAWSPDAQFLAYAHGLPGETYIALLDLDDGTTRTIYRADQSIGAMAFHPSGEELFFVLDRNQYDAHVWRLSLATGRAEPITRTQNWHEWSFAISLEGDRLLLESGRYGGADLYAVELNDTLRAERLTDTPEINEFGVAWAPDGRRIWFEQENGVDRLVVQAPGGASAVERFASPYSEKTLGLTPDGSAAIVADARRLVRVDLASGESRAIPFTAEFEVADRRPGDIVVTNARVFTGRGDEYVENATVVVRDGRIASVEAGGADDAIAYAGAAPDSPVIDAGGKVLMAGLMDNHRHYWGPFAGDRLLASGITAIRDPGVSISTSMQFKDANALGLLPGPRIYSAGPLIDGPHGYHPAVDVSITDPAAAPALVRALHAQGVDALKVYFMLDREVAAAVIAEARELDLPVTGHIGVHTSWGEAIDAGIHGFSHIRVWRDFLPPELQPDGLDESLDSGRDRIARMQADWRLIDPDGPEVGGLIQRMAESGAALDATLAIQRINDGARQSFGLEEFEIARESFGKMQRFVRRVQQAGVPLLAGTDNINLVTELQAYAEAGVPNAEILRAATVNGAQWLGLGEEFGTVEPGRRADLILVEGDPLEDVGDLRNIRMVIQEGRIVVRNEAGATAAPTTD